MKHFFCKHDFTKTVYVKVKDDDQSKYNKFRQCSKCGKKREAT